MNFERQPLAAALAVLITAVLVLVCADRTPAGERTAMLASNLSAAQLAGMPGR